MLIQRKKKDEKLNVYGIMYDSVCLVYNYCVLVSYISYEN